MKDLKTLEEIYNSLPEGKPRGEIKASPRNEFLGTIADGLNSVVGAKPLRGLIAGEIIDSALGGTASLIDDISYQGLGALFTGGNVATGGIGTIGIDPRAAELALNVTPAGQTAKQGGKVAANQLGPKAAEMAEDYMRSQGLIKNIVDQATYKKLMQKTAKDGYQDRAPVGEIFLNEFSQPSSELEKLYSLALKDGVGLQRVMVPVDQLVPTQRMVKYDNLKKVNKDSLGSDDPVSGVFDGDRVYLTDGHHRAANAILEGKGEVEVELFSLTGSPFNKVGLKVDAQANQPSTDLSSYAGTHRAPPAVPGSTIDDMSDIYPKDVYSKKGVDYYGDGSPWDKESHRAIMSAAGNPNKKIKIYRAVPKGVKVINPGDWITPSKSYAKMHGEKYLGDYEIIESEALAKELGTDGNSLSEFGYWPVD